MKFACDRCGKRYASVDEPAAGRVYRIRCRCGHAIVVRGPSSAPPDEAADRLRSFEPAPLPPPLACAETPSAPPPVASSPSPSPSPSPPKRLMADDQSRRARAAAQPDTTGAVGTAGDPGGRAPGHEEDAAMSAAQSAVAAAAAAEPVLSLGLDDDGASGARRRVLLAAIAALLAVGTALAVWRM